MNGIFTLPWKEIFGWISGVLCAASVFVEIAPVKINPVSALLKWIGKRMTGDVLARVEELEAKTEEQNAVNCRVRILRFGDEIRREVRHSMESFDQVLSDIDTYERYCETHRSFKNNKTAATTAKIKQVYLQRMDSNDFL